MRHFITFKGIDEGLDVSMDVSAICSSMDTTVTDARCSTSFGSCAGSASFTMRYTTDKVTDPYTGAVIDRRSLYSAAVDGVLTCMERRLDIEVTLRTDDLSAVVFRGRANPSDMSLSRTRLPGAVTLSCVDVTSRLDSRIGLNLVHEVSETVNSTIEDLLSRCYGASVPALVSDIPDGQALKAPLVVTGEGSLTYRQAIDKVLQAAGGYVLHYVHSTGSLEIVRCVPDEVDDSALRTVSFMVPDGIQTKTGIYQHDGVLLKWPTIEARTDANVYSEDIELKYTEDGIIGRLIGNGVYHPENGDVTKTVQNYRESDSLYVTGASRTQNRDLSLIYAKDAELGVIAEQVTCRVKASVADMDELEALTGNQLGDFRRVIDIDEYRVFDGSGWIFTDAPALGPDGKGRVYVDGGSVPTFSDLPATAAQGTTVTCLDTGYRWCRMDGEWQRRISEFCLPVLHTADVDMTDGNPAFYPLSMWALLRNRSGALVNLKAMSVTAVAVERTEVNSTTQPGVLTEPDEVETDSVSEPAAAESLALWLCNSRRNSMTTAQWYEWEDARVLSSLGERVRVEYSEGRTSVFCVIQIEDVPVTRLSRRRRVTAVMVSGFETSFSGSTVAAVNPSVIDYRRVVGVTEMYGESDSGSSMPAYWTETRTITKGRYLWTRTVTSYSDGTSETMYTVVYNGEDGSQGESAQIQYALGSSIIDPPADEMLWGGETMLWNGDPMLWQEGLWTDEVPEMERGLYIWMRTRTGDAPWQYTRLTGTTVWDAENLGVATTETPKQSKQGLGLIPGDYFIAGAQFTENGVTYRKGFAYSYNGTDWSVLDLSDADNSGKALQCLSDLMTSGINVTDSTASIWGWFEHLVSQDAVIRNLISRNIQVGDGNGTAGSGFRFRARDYDEYGNKLTLPDFDVYYGDTKLFDVDSDGKIYFGSGFWYDPSDQSIHSTNDKILIDDDGILTTVDAVVSGAVTANTFNFGGVDMKWLYRSYTANGTYYIDLSSEGVSRGDLVSVSGATLGSSGDPLPYTTVSVVLDDEARSLTNEVVFINNSYFSVAYIRNVSNIGRGLKVVAKDVDATAPLKLSVQAYHESNA